MDISRLMVEGGVDGKSEIFSLLVFGCFRCVVMECLIL